MKFKYKIYIVLVIGIIFLFSINNVCFGNEDYTINTVEELKKFAEEVNNGNTFEGKTVYLMSDINLEGNEENQWNPIGNATNSFKGTFEGNGHIVRGIYINNDNVKYSGFFGYNSGIIKNIGVYGTISRGYYVAGICAYNLGKIYQCYSKVDLYGESINIGGIVAWNGTIRYRRKY